MVLLMIGVLFCCGAGFFIRRRIYPSPLRDEPAFNVSFTRHPVATAGRRAPSAPPPQRTVRFGRVPPGFTYVMRSPYPPPPSYCSHPPPPYEQIFQNADKK
uniref:WW domain binding protein VOPP1 n=1 Tax=Oryzias sinensis TaxID=183150 RepID=A0A8C7YEM0_9TELE